MTVREGCGYDIPIEASCFNPVYQNDQPRVFINEARWVRGAVPFQGDIGSYRQYVVNHEVGHAIGYQDHEPCAENGALAPVMMQQTFSTSNNDDARFDPESVQARRQDLPVQPLAVSDRLTARTRAGWSRLGQLDQPECECHVLTRWSVASFTLGPAERPTRREGNDWHCR